MTDPKPTTGTDERKYFLKTEERLWDAIEDGSKTAEFRRDDRDFQVGDTIEAAVRLGIVQPVKP